MKLINLSNHPSEKWTEEQKSGFTEIIDIPFPDISPEANIQSVKYLAEEYYQKIVELVPKFEKGVVNLMLQGEYSFCYILLGLIMNGIEGLKVKLFIPTTKREVVEDSNGLKISKFTFKQWRIIDVNAI